jgi:carbon starvation protein
MFEALFILTTLDAGTRVGRFMLQDLGGHVWKPFGRVSWQPASIMASAIVVLCWGYFLYQGVTDPLGGVNTLWPLFGISNQLLAAIALCVGTTVVIKMGKAKYSFITLAPLTWLTIVNMTAGMQKIFASDPKLGFLSHASWIQGFLDKGELPPGVASAANASRMIFNDRLDAAVAAFFLVAVVVILAASMKEWFAVIGGKKPAMSSEVPFTPKGALAPNP